MVGVDRSRPSPFAVEDDSGHIVGCVKSMCFDKGTLNCYCHCRSGVAVERKMLVEHSRRSIELDLVPWLQINAYKLDKLT